jgi:hypothetical protein
MRDPDLVVRAQQAATALESAWCRWRKLHGLAADPAPSVSSYVGYSLEAPWGQSRIVFGICAEDAELLAALLERHDCVGPVHASVQAKSVGSVRGSSPVPAAPSQPAAPELPVAAARPDVPALPGGSALPGTSGLVRVPAPAPASAGQQAVPAAPRPGPLPPPRRPDAAASSALTNPSAPIQAGVGTPIALAASRAVEASTATRRKTVTPSPGGHGARAAGPTGPGPGPATDERGAPHAGGPSAPDRASEPARRAAQGPAESVDSAAQTIVGGVSPVPGPSGIVAFRPRSDSPGYPPDSRDRPGSAATAEATAWTASELPGQAAVSDTAV